LSIEGAAALEGRTDSIWDAVSAAPGRIVDDSTGAVAVDHYHRYQEDVQLLSELGVDAYRFSISWPRVQPGGKGPANSAGLDFYDRLVDRLLAAGITPWATLYHWDLPVELMLAGGWLERDTADALGDFAVIVADRIADRVQRWTTMADPLVHMAYGHALGIDAPGLTLLDRAFPVAHHLLLGHARALEVLTSQPQSSVGIANHHTTVFPASTHSADISATLLYDAYHNRQFTEPIFSGRYPRLLQPLIDRHDGLIKDGDMAAIAQPLDFYGVNYQHPATVAAAPENRTIPFSLTEMPGVAVTDDESPIHPRSLTAVLTNLHRRYPRLPPLVVTANGAAYADAPTESAGGLDLVNVIRTDRSRIDYLHGHLGAIADAYAAGVDVRGYFHRGLTDAWEGSEGFTRQFGLVHVDPATLQRSPRASYAYFRDVISAHRAQHASPALPK